MNRVEIMGGKVLDLEAKRILNQGLAEGLAEGRREGLIQGSIQVFRDEMGLEDASIAEKIMKLFRLTREEADACLRRPIPDRTGARKSRSASRKPAE